MLKICFQGSAVPTLLPHLQQEENTIKQKAQAAKTDTEVSANIGLDKMQPKVQSPKSEKFRPDLSKPYKSKTRTKFRPKFRQTSDQNSAQNSDQIQTRIQTMAR